MGTRIRFTGKWPPPELLGHYPNWVYAWEEGRSGQNETTIKPAGLQECLSEDIVYTAGDVWFPDDDCYPALIKLRDYQPIGLVVYEGNAIWEIHHDSRAGRWTSFTSSDPPISFDDANRFPLRFISRLPESRKVGEIRRVISPQGFAREWVYEG